MRIIVGIVISGFFAFASIMIFLKRGKFWTRYNNIIYDSIYARKKIITLVSLSN